MVGWLLDISKVEDDKQTYGDGITPVHNNCLTWREGLPVEERLEFR